MKIYIIWHDINADCAELTALNYNPANIPTCPECGAQKGLAFVKPEAQIVEWIPGSDKICHFIECARSYGELFIQENVKKALSEFKSKEYIRFEMWQDPKISPPKRITRRSVKRIWLPYQGPPIYLMWVNHWVNADLSRSTINIVKVCSLCGLIFRNLVGIERNQIDTLSFEWIRVPREPGKGVFVTNNDVDNIDLFRITEVPGAVFCTERVKDVIEKEGFNNVVLLEAGETI